MSRLNGKGPDDTSSKTGRGLGCCSDADREKMIAKLGKGMGLRRKQGGGKGQGKRLQSGNK